VADAIDLVVAVVRASVFLSSLQAAGAALVLLLLPSAAAVNGSVRRLLAWSAGSCAALLIVRSLLEPARMAGSIVGVADPFLQSLFWRSDIGIAQTARMLGVCLLLMTFKLRAGLVRPLWVVAIGLIVGSFALMGHTRSHGGGVLSGLLVIHIASVAFWFGSLVPLIVLLRLGPSDALTETLRRFSRLALWLVAALVAAGGLLAWRLLGSVDRLITPYGLLVLAKILGVLVLLLLAAVNRQRLTPAIAIGREDALRIMIGTIRAELGLMAAIFFATAWMTTFYSPE